MSRSNDMDDLNTWHEDRPICPYCNHAQATDDLREGDSIETCADCDREFELTVEFEPQYSTYKMEDTNAS
jgi:ribosomal protein L37AE/L43A